MRRTHGNHDRRKQYADLDNRKQTALKNHIRILKVNELGEPIGC